MPDTKNLLLRLDPDLAEQVQTIASIEDRAVSEVIREAIRDLVEARRRDRSFQKRVKAVAAQQEAALRALLDDEPDR